MIPRKLCNKQSAHGHYFGGKQIGIPFQQQINQGVSRPNYGTEQLVISLSFWHSNLWRKLGRIYFYSLREIKLTGLIPNLWLKFACFLFSFKYLTVRHVCLEKDRGGIITQAYFICF